jgi:hypothetical protein
MLWAWWVGGGIVLVCAYWSVTTRLVLFLMPPLIFSAAAALEAAWDDRRLSRLHIGSVAAVAAFTLALASVDYRYASAQKSLAGMVVKEYATPDKKLWCASHWGLQYYLESLGAQELDWTEGGWDAVKPGDVAVLSSVNPNVLWPKRKVPAEVRRIRVESAIPLRLISGWGGQAGFYSNMTGFLPFAFSREPLDEFTIVRIR